MEYTNGLKNLGVKFIKLHNWILKSWDFILKRSLNRIPQAVYFWILFVVGTVFRIRQYLSNRSLWLDECFLAINLKERNYGELLKPLEYSQVAPIGFLWSEKLVITFLGSSEYALRLIPLISGILAIILIYYFVKSLWNHPVALTSTFLFIFSTNYIYYSSEVKQYSTDIFFSLLLFWFYMKYYRHEYPSFKRILVFSLIGIISVWMSNVAIIILASIGIDYLILQLRKDRFRNLLKSSITFVSWIVSFGFYFFHFIYEHPHSKVMRNFWRNDFLPANSLSESLSWIGIKVYAILRRGIAFYPDASTITAMLIIGLVLLIGFRKFKQLLILIPIVVHILLSAFQLYPFGGRTSLYLSPFFIIIIASGYYLVTIPTRNKFYLILMILLLYFTTPGYRGLAIQRFKKPVMKEHIKPTLKYIKDNIRERDKIYVYYGSIAPFRFYNNLYELDQYEAIIGILPTQQERFKGQFNTLSGRIWILFSHMNHPDAIAYIHDQIKMHSIIDQFHGEGSKTILIEMNGDSNK